MCNYNICFPLILDHELCSTIINYLKEIAVKQLYLYNKNSLTDENMCIYQLFILGMKCFPYESKYFDL